MICKAPQGTGNSGAALATKFPAMEHSWARMLMVGRYALAVLTPARSRSSSQFLTLQIQPARSSLVWGGTAGSSLGVQLCLTLLH